LLVIAAIFSSQSLSESRLRSERYKSLGIVYRGQVDACLRGNDLRSVSNDKTFSDEAIAAAVKLFVIETRRSRSDPDGSSYDPHFVRVIDHWVLPRLNNVSSSIIPEVPCVGKNAVVPRPQGVPEYHPKIKEP